jgi:hypothetical protein
MPSPTPPAPPSFDLRSLLRAVGGGAATSAALTAPPAARTDVAAPVELVDVEPSEVSAAPAPVRAFVDGVQHARVLTWHGHRPVYLTYVAAAGLGARREVHALRESLELVCATPDAEWAGGVADEVPVRVLTAETPGEVESEAFAALGGAREEQERLVTADLLADPDPRTVVLDGTLVGRPFDRRLGGVVKSVDRRYLPDEEVLWSLPVGWRSPRFKIPAGIDAAYPRYSCYLRLFSASRRPWHFALVRLETFDLDALDSLAARCLVERQGPAARDGRWERHLGAVRQVEEYLRARRPPVFT